MVADASRGYAAKAQPGWQDADLPLLPSSISRNGRAWSGCGRTRPGIAAPLYSGEPDFQRVDPAQQNLLLLPRLGRHRFGRLELLATDQVHPGEHAFEL